MGLDLNILWEEFSLPLQSFIRQRIPNHEDANDVLQEVFIKVNSGIKDLRDDQKISAWIYRITRNAIADHYRRSHGALEMSELPEYLTAEVPEDPTATLEIAACLIKMIESLPDNYKEAILLTEFGNLTQKELSNKLGLSLPGAKSRVQRGRAKLKEMLLGCCQIEFDKMGNVIDYRHKSRDCKYC